MTDHHDHAGHDHSQAHAGDAHGPGHSHARRASGRRSPSASPSTSASSSSRPPTGSWPTRWPCWPTPATTSRTCSACVLAWGATVLAQARARAAATPTACARLVDPGRPVQRGAPAGRGRRHRLGGDPALRRARPGRRQDRDGRRRVGILINGITAWLFARGSQGRPQHPRRLPAHGRRRRRLAGRGRRRPRHPLHRLGSGSIPLRQPRHRGGHRLGTWGLLRDSA